MKIITNNSDLMDDIHALVGCEYLSDLKSEGWRLQTLRSISTIPLAVYSLIQWSYIFSYLFEDDVHFNAESEVHDYLQRYIC